jgi:hypothetical protein
MDACCSFFDFGALESDTRYRKWIDLELFTSHTAVDEEKWAVNKPATRPYLNNLASFDVMAR